MKVTYFGTTVLLFDDGINQILFDAYFTRPSISKAILKKLSTDTLEVDNIIKKYNIDRLRGIFVSHSHIDHVMDAPYLANITGANIYGSKSTLNVAKGGNIPDKLLFSFDESLDYSIGDFSIKVIPSIHSKAHWYNNDLGETIDEPVVQPARKNKYKEGGSYDFIVKHSGKTYIIRPSCNYIKGQLDEYQADVLFLGIGGMSKTDEDFKKTFFYETIDNVSPEIVIPIHWDNFFTPLSSEKYLFPSFLDHTESAMHELISYCNEKGVTCIVQMPMTTLSR